MNADDYQKQAARTENTPNFIDHHRRKLRESGIPSPLLMEHATRDDLTLSRLMHAVMGMITELGEFVDPLKKNLIYGKAIDTTNLGEEIGDGQWYMALAANALETKLADIFDRNIAKLRVRFPDKFTEQQALNRDLDAERKALEETQGNIGRSEIDARLEGRDITSVIRDHADGTGSFLRQLLWRAGQEIERLREVNVPRSIDQTQMMAAFARVLSQLHGTSITNVGPRPDRAADEALCKLTELQQLLETEKRGRMANYNDLVTLRAKIKAFSSSNS